MNSFIVVVGFTIIGLLAGILYAAIGIHDMIAHEIDRRTGKER